MMYGSKNTVHNSKYGIKLFLSSIYNEKVNYSNLESYADRYLKEKRGYQKDIDNFFIKLNGRPPASTRTILAVVKTFFTENGIDPGDRFWKRLTNRIKGHRALMIDHIPTNEELKQVIQHMPLHGKLIYLMLSSSGMRIGECMHLKISDVELDSDPCKINVRSEYTKTGNSRITFIASS
jgi:integrase